MYFALLFEKINLKTGINSKTIQHEVEKSFLIGIGSDGSFGTLLVILVLYDFYWHDYKPLHGTVFTEYFEEIVKAFNL